MNTDTIIEKAPVPVINNNDPELGFISIDVEVKEWRFHFTFAMLRLARIVLKNEEERWGFTAAQVSRMLNRHTTECTWTYRPMEIREQFWNNVDEIRGGGYKVEWQEIEAPRRLNDPPHYTISFSRVYRMADLLKCNDQKPNNQQIITQ